MPDLIAMTWSSFDGDIIEVVQEKTGAKVWIPCHPELKAALEKELTLRTAQTILTGATGKPWELGPFQTAVSMAIRGAGLQGIVWHGLRATAAKWMAEAGCSERENMSITGHTSSAMVGRYVREASQKRQARSAATKVAEYRLKQGIAKPGENGVPNHSKAEAASDPEKA